MVQRPRKEDGVERAVVEVVPVSVSRVDTQLAGPGDGLFRGVDGNDAVPRVHEGPGELTTARADLEQPESWPWQGAAHELHGVRGEDIDRLHGRNSVHHPLAFGWSATVSQIPS